MSVQSDKELEPIEVAEFRVDDQGLNVPISGDDSVPEPLPGWAMPGRRDVKHPRMNRGAGAWPASWGTPTAERLGEFYPQSFAEAGGEAGMPKGPMHGFAIGGRPPHVVWRDYLLNLANRQVAIDAADSGTLLVTSGALVGLGKPAVLVCRTCHERDVALGMDGQCAGGCK